LFHFANIFKKTISEKMKERRKHKHNHTDTTLTHKEATKNESTFQRLKQQTKYIFQTLEEETEKSFLKKKNTSNACTFHRTGN